MSTEFGERVDVPAWKKLQLSAFLGWANTRISRASAQDEELRTFAEFPEKVLTDFFDNGAGSFWALLAAVCKDRPRRPRGVGAARPKGVSAAGAGSNFATRGVVEFCLQHLEQVEQVRLVNIGASDCIEKNEKLILGLFWKLILHYQMAAAPGNEMLAWVNAQISGQEYASVADFKSSWQDGRGFAALTNATIVKTLGAADAQKHLISYSNQPGILPRAEAIALMTKVFQTAFEVLAVPKLLDAELVYDTPDDLAVQTYVSFFRSEEIEAQQKASVDLAQCLASFSHLVLAETNDKSKYKGPKDLTAADAPSLYNAVGCHNEKADSTVRAVFLDYLHRIRQSVATTQQQVTIEEKRATEATTKAVALEATISQVQSRAQVAEKQVVDLEHVKVKTEERASEAETRVKALEAEMQQLQAANQKLQHEMDLLRKASGDSSSESKARIVGLETQVDSLTVELKAEKKLTLESAQMAAGLVDQIQTLQTGVEQMRKEQETATRTLKVAQLKGCNHDRNEMPPNYHELPPPEADENTEVTLCFTDVQDSTKQWEAYPEVMAAALKVHNSTIRHEIAYFQGYEVKTEGDAFMVAFDDATRAAQWALSIQRKLVSAPWPKELEENALAASAVDPEKGFRGLRVRVGMHTGRPQAERDPVTGRMDYFGRMVNKSARIEGLADGGQVVMSSDTHAQVKRNVDKLLPDGGKPLLNPMGSFELKGIEGKAEAFMLLAPEHGKRNTPLPAATTPPPKSQDASGMMDSLMITNEKLGQKLAKTKKTLLAAKKDIGDFVSKIASATGDNPELRAVLLSVERHIMEEDFGEDEADGADNAFQQSLEDLLRAQAELKSREQELDALNRANGALEGDIALARRRIEEAEAARLEAEERARLLAAKAAEGDHLQCNRLRAEIERKLIAVKTLEDKGALIAAAMENPDDPRLMQALKVMMPAGHVGDVTFDDLEELAESTSDVLLAARAELADLRERLRLVHTIEHADEGASKAVEKEARLEELVNKLVTSSTPRCPKCKEEHHVRITPMIRREGLGDQSGSNAPATAAELFQLFNIADKLRTALVVARKKKEGGNAAEVKAFQLLSAIDAAISHLVRTRGGGVYHRSCFKCSVDSCRKSLMGDMEYFYLKGHAKNHAVNDEILFCSSHPPTKQEALQNYQRPRALKADNCALCKVPVVPGQAYLRVPPNDQVYHEGCLLCEKCGNELDDFGVQDGDRLCRNCLPNLQREIGHCVESIKLYATKLTKLHDKVSSCREFYEAQRAVVEANGLKKFLEENHGDLPFPQFEAYAKEQDLLVLANEHVLRYKYIAQDIIIYAKNCLGVMQSSIRDCGEARRAIQLRIWFEAMAHAVESAADKI